MTDEGRYPPEHWTDALRDICREACAYPYGEPPCWQVMDQIDGKPSEGPCWSCVSEWMEGYQTDD